MKTLFKARLVTRGYPKDLLERIAATVSYKDRAQLLHQSRPPPPQPRCYPPLYKCPPPPQYKLLKQIVLENYHPLQKVLPAPRFIPLRHTTLSNELVRTRLSPTNEQLIDIYITLSNHTASSDTTAGQLPHSKHKVLEQSDATIQDALLVSISTATSTSLQVKPAIGTSSDKASPVLHPI